MVEADSPKTAPAPKPKRTLSEDQLAKLKIAREKALEVKRAMKEKSDDKKIKHFEEKIMKIKGKQADEPPSEEAEPEALEAVEEVEPEPELEPEVIVKKSKPKKKTKPIIICEESSESEDDSNVIYIKKGGRSKGKKQESAPLPEPPAPPPLPQVQRQVIMNPNPFYRYNINPHYM